MIEKYLVQAFTFTEAENLVLKNKGVSEVIKIVNHGIPPHFVFYHIKYPSKSLFFANSDTKTSRAVDPGRPLVSLSCRQQESVDPSSNTAVLFQNILGVQQFFLDHVLFLTG